jgi:excisionase family DNA binding protein
VGDDRRLTTKDTAERIGVTRSFLYQLAEAGTVPHKIEHRPHGRRYVFLESDIQDYLDKGGYVRTRHPRSGSPPPATRHGLESDAPSRIEVELARQRDEFKAECAQLREQLAEESRLRVAADVLIDELRRALEVRNQMLRLVADGGPSMEDLLGPRPDAGS